MKKGLLFICLFILSWSIFAQNIVVESFVHIETDLTANLEGTTVFDQNGEKCALIKVRSNPPTKDFIFDVGQLGIQEVRYDGPDIWLYVPYGVRRITIKHSQLGVLDDYDLGISVKKASTYILTLRVGSIQTVIEDEIRQQYLMFTVEPKDALVEVDNEVWEVTDGSCAKLLNFGTYEYRIRSQYYHDEVGKVTLNNANDTKVISVNLRPAHGWIEVNGVGDLAGATVYVDDEKVGLAPVKTRKLSSGSYRVRIVKDLFHVYSENVVVEDNQTTVLSPTLMGNYSIVTITTKSGAEIWIDGERKGVSTWSGRLSFGGHLMEAKMASHRSQSKTINIAESETTKAILLPDPQPMYGSLSVEVLPDFADVYINGEKVGTTPQMIREMLVGEYKVEVRKEGKTSHEEQVVVREGELSSVRGELQDEDLAFNVNGVEFKMIRVEGGEFMMGGGYVDRFHSGERHLVSLDSYFIGETEVTQALWVAVMGKNPTLYSDDRTPDRPVGYVSWKDCQKFIKRLNKLTGKQFRLPTEAEWEYAARGGNRSQGYKYSGSNNLDDVGWYNDGNYDLHPVAQKQSNELGLYDMSGNVKEWCSDWYDPEYYENSPKHNPQGPNSSKIFNRRVQRGGDYFSGGEHFPISISECSVSYRSYSEPKTRYSEYGLRLALVLE